MIKRLFDLLFSSFALTVIFPFLGILYPLVKLDSPGAFFFRQKRMGLHGSVFRIFKIRTMRSGADSEGRGITTHNDPRVTNIGGFLRKTKLDELPQFINVWLGHMSIVGPRPELPRYRDVNPEQWQEILSVRPGITDIASLEYFSEEALLPDGADADEVYRREILPAKQQLYIYYIKNRTFFTDIIIILRTLKRIIFGVPHNPVKRDSGNAVHKKMDSL